MPRQFARSVFSFFAVVLLLASAHAETRWCNLQGFNQQLVYPPIAKAARVSGLVFLRLTYEPSGKIIDIDSIRGPVMLVEKTKDQLKQTTVKTNADGAAFCQSLLIVDYQLDDGHLLPLSAPPALAGGLYEVIRTVPIVLSDPAAIVGRRKFLGIF